MRIARTKVAEGELPHSRGSNPSWIVGSGVAMGGLREQPGLSDESGHQRHAGTTILRLPAVKSRTGLSRSTIYQMIATGDFPRAVPLGRRAVGWLVEEVDEWIAACISKRAGPGRAEAAGRSSSERAKPATGNVRERAGQAGRARVKAARADRS